MAYIIKIRSHKFDMKSITVEPVMFLYMFTVFLSNLTFQALVYDKVCKEHYNSTICSQLGNITYKEEEDVVQKETSTWLLYNNLAMGLPSLFSVVLFLGPWGDTVNRKIPVICPLVGSFLVSVSNMINSVYMDAPLVYLLFGQFLNGLLGGFIAALMSMYSYIAYVSSPSYRTIKIGILEGMIFLSATVGTAISGVILDKTSYVFVFSFLAGLMMLALIYTIVWVDSIPSEQTLDANSDRKSSCRSLFLDTIKDAFMCVYQSRRNENFLNLALAIFIIFILMLVSIGEIDILLIYTRNRPFNWSQTTLGLYDGLESFLRGIAVLTFLPLLKRKFGVRDTMILVVGLVSKTASLIVLGLGRSTVVLFIGATSGVLQGFSSAGIRSMTSGMVSSNEQAKLFSLIGMFESVSTLAATSLFNTVYTATIDFYPGFCFLMAAVLSGICIFIACILHIKVSKNTAGNYDTLQNETVQDVPVGTDNEVQS
ncbi:proton-coupled folate transporter-like [Ruditapes philippinarum]|uniref:proton-coupled folate transporter-like n=1 Tax=Ruditapes philippinarum TaxID=129788 RepID=UPI00295BEB5C|nr:proton-coupled folate transporter-like [Ruditapes philippinarum]